MEKNKATETQNVSEDSTKRNLPEKKFTAGVISAAVWRNTVKGETGEPIEFRTVSFERRYTNKSGIWKSTNSLRVHDLPKAATVLKKAYEYLTMGA